jgi:DNA modification methylase
MGGTTHAANQHTDTGTAARFFFQSHWSYDIYERLNHADSVFYTSKSGGKEREAGLDDLAAVTRNRVNSGGYENDPKWKPTQRRNNHPTVKPISLTKYLATLLLPPAAYAPRRILVPFAGSGSEMIGAMLAGWDEVHGCEIGADYARIAAHRLDWWHKQMAWGCSDPEIILAASDEKKGDSAGVQLSLLEATP